MTRALLFGGTGYLGEQVLRRLTDAGVATTFTHFRQTERAAALAKELSQPTVPIDLRDGEAIRGVLAEQEPPDVFVSCAGIADTRPLAEVDDAGWDETLAVNVRAPFIACRELFTEREGAVVFTAALDAVRSLSSPPHFAASQAALVGLTRSLAKELGPRVRVNLVAIGPLDGGIAGEFAQARKVDYQRFSALGRLGTAEEAARAITWLALENTYMTGAVLPITGGL